ncbi:MAG: ester cyclase [Acidobacteriota bacterium]
MSEEANKQLVRQHYEDLVNQNNLAAADEQMAEDFIDHGALPGVVSRGPESARQAMVALHAAVPDVHVTLDEVIAEGDIVAVRATWRGTHQGPLAGIPPSGKPVTVKGMVFWRVANGKLVERWATVDLSSLRAQPPK